MRVAGDRGANPTPCRPAVLRGTVSAAGRSSIEVAAGLARALNEGLPTGRPEAPIQHDPHVMHGPARSMVSAR